MKGPRECLSETREEGGRTEGWAAGRAGVDSAVVLWDCQISGYRVEYIFRSRTLRLSLTRRRCHYS